MSENKKNIKKFPSELRFDLISGDWVVIATGRARRPEMFKKRKETEEVLPPELCPFCQMARQKKPVLIFAQGKKLPPQSKLPQNWTTVVIPNKYPAFIPSQKIVKKKEGPFYEIIQATGFHEVVITRDHWRSLALFKVEEVKEIIDVYHDRFQNLMNKKFVNYISIFHNHKAEAGASIFHPHSQIITTPLIDVDLNKAIVNADRYYQKTKKCLYCEVGKWEMKVKKRIIFENKHFFALCPFASKSAFEMIISPKKHLSYFQEITEEEKWSLAEAFQIVLYKLYKGLADPAYNFYLHTAPTVGKFYPQYHWHWTILPKTAVWAGFEIGTGMEISTIEPEKAAAYLRKQ
ncbi:MAG: galactose-1-phosphate uridylyltransferase [Minisyncoccales bacterium]